MEDVAQEVEARAPDGLLRKEIVLRGPHSPQRRRDRQRLRHVLQNNSSAQGRERGRERSALVAEAAADVDERRDIILATATGQGRSVRAQLDREGEHGEPRHAKPGARATWPAERSRSAAAARGVTQSRSGRLKRISWQPCLLLLLGRDGSSRLDRRERRALRCRRCGNDYRRIAVCGSGQCFGGVVGSEGILAHFLNLVD